MSFPTVAPSRRESGSVVGRWGRGALVVAVATTVLQASPAAAAPDAPVLTGPSGQVSGTPEITWEPTPGATGYELQVDDDPAFGSPEWKLATPNTVAVPYSPLSPGLQHVQVRAKDATNTWSPWSTGSFTQGLVPAPELESPADGAALQQPSESPLLRWSPVANATGYTVEIATESGFVAPKTYTTKATSFVVPDNQAPDKRYHWRVRATLAAGIHSDVSAHRSYTVLPLALPDVTGPGNDVDVTDVVLDWEPVPGATHYELQVDDDHDFSSPETGIPARIHGTRFSPRTTFGNEQYYWRVRAVDPDGNPTAWTTLAPETHYEFDRVWREVPQLVHPSDPAGGPDRAIQFVGDDLYYEWTPVPNASHYEVWLSTDVNFTAAKTSVCKVVGTTYTPGELNDDCMPSAEGITYFWKVRPVDLPYKGGLVGIFSEAQRFVYDDATAFRINTPAPGATVDVPTLDWEPVASAEKYKVELFNGRGSSVLTATTYSTSYTPLRRLEVADGPFQWRLTALDASGRTTTTQGRSFEVSGVTPASLTPLAPVAAPATFDAPTLRWGALEEAEHYSVSIGSADTTGYFLSTVAPILSWKTPYSSATDISTRFLAEGRYKWYVSAYDKEGTLLGSGPVGHFEVRGLGPVTGHRLALTGSGLDRGDACTARLRVEGPCAAVPTTPVLDWSPTPYASFYRVHVSKDGDFTTGALTKTPPQTVNTRWAPRDGYAQKALQDSMASTPYFWFIQPCKTKDLCGPDPTSTIEPADHAFRKTSPRLVLGAPADRATVTSTEVTFDWEDYLVTNRRAVYGPTGEASTQSAMTYQLQVSTQPTFATTLESVEVDQTTYTSPDQLYPEGPLYWRVQPIDAAGNRLGWSETRTLEKSSPQPTLLSPSSDGPRADLTGSVPLVWEAQPFAATYDVQVAANGDTNFSSGNLRVSGSSKRPAYTTGGTVRTLEPSLTPYVWRVRRRDPKGNLGPWSEPMSFYVGLEHPELVSPAAGAVVGPRALVLRWKRVPEAMRYRIQYRRTGTTSTTTVTTSASAFAPATALVLDATYEWRVEALDTDNRVVGQSDVAESGWRRFTVGGVPKALVPPSVGGSPVLGGTLSVTAPTWSVPGVDDTYQWRRNGAAIDGAIDASYVVSVDDVDQSLTVQVTGTSREFGVGTVVSDSVRGLPGTGPLVVSGPQITGSGKVGTTLTSTPVTWDSDGVQSSYQWLRNGAAILGATGESYGVVPADVGAAITLRVSGTLKGREVTTVISDAVTGVTGAAPTLVQPPTISGLAKVGQLLTATRPTWDSSGVTQDAQWLRDGQPVPGEVGSVYSVRPADVGAQVSVRYTARLLGHEPGSATSAAVVVAQGDAPVAGPASAPWGNPAPGSTLTAPSVTWDLVVEQSWQWLRDGQAIAGQTGRTYVVQAADAGRQVAVRITGSRPGHAAGTTTSPAVTVSAPAAPPAAPPTAPPPPVAPPGPGPVVVTSTTQLKAPPTVRTKGRTSVRPTVKVTVKASGATPAGTVRVYAGRKVVGTATLTASGTVKIRLKKLPIGRHKLRARYLGVATVAASASRTVVLRVLR